MFITAQAILQTAIIRFRKALHSDLIDESGKTIVDFKYQDITPLYEGVAWAKKKVNGVW